MPQRWIIRLLPIEIFLFAMLAGWYLVNGMQTVIEAAPPKPEPAASAGAVLSPIFTPEVQHWGDKIVEWSAAHKIDPNLVATVMQIESCGLASAVSSAGAQGLFQVMPFHFAAEENMQDPDTNASRGLAYLALGLTRGSGNVGLALAGYNGGHSQIGRDSSLWPNQTKRYWYWGTGIYQDTLEGKESSARLQEWLTAGGASLCARAAKEIGLAP